MIVLKAPDFKIMSKDTTFLIKNKFFLLFGVKLANPLETVPIFSLNEPR